MSRALINGEYLDVEDEIFTPDPQAEIQALKQENCYGSCNCRRISRADCLHRKTPCENKSVGGYRMSYIDNRSQFKEITEEERQEILAKERENIERID